MQPSAQAASIASLVGPAATGAAMAIGQAPAFAMGATYLALADSIALAMENAVANQQRGQVLADAALTQILALIIQKGATSS
ncbi:RebB family R body protein [Xanthomonas melonis]|uniref:RebB family R body protein n=2 Tax=Xanthomonas TaxID=338 RepID=A0A2S7DFE3_9XANT|nr:RebB family R body protein [Xanthomonas melonis]MCC4586616.1 RebB family R body protein [Xanthomonas sp. NCPPB 1067]MCC4599346.1 RebB family R body protein [Xanthomonas melonis]MCD0247584.1 RebB family R body protein [Xanthomonas melonis]MCD0260057.1 RebB family R body protein [Xanthomonas melonis]MCD0266985.1 RebB family R body protein [Xanthomonas melonis]